MTIYRILRFKENIAAARIFHNFKKNDERTFYPAKAAALMNFIRERPTLARRAAGRSAGLSAERR
jgi:hypothetical protein